MASTATTVEGYDEASIVAASAARSEPDWLLDRRVEAARAFAAVSNPTPALRPWKYTNVTDLDFASFPPAEAAIAISGDVPEGNGPHSGGAWTLAKAVEESLEVVQSDLGALVPATEGKFIAANTALWSSGTIVNVPKGVVCEQPIEIEVSGVAAGPSAIFPRLLVNVGEQAEVTIMLRLRSEDVRLLVAGVIEINAGDASRVRLLIDERWGAATQDFTTVRSKLGRDADVIVATIAIGGHIVKHTVEALIEGEGANSVIRGVVLGDHEQHFDFVTLQDHQGARTTSDVAIKAALAGASRSIYYGITRVEETAKGAEANQVNRNLLLSTHSKADSDPVLEILTADVIRCGHGATVGPVDSGALFYLQSRGMDYRSALKLLVQGFFADVLRGIPIDGLEEELQELVTAKLTTAEL
jgi:Fe-S cluster assembly protein SufD